MSADVTGGGGFFISKRNAPTAPPVRITKIKTITTKRQRFDMAWFLSGRVRPESGTKFLHVYYVCA
jgi:hypothetical protein